MSDLAPKEQSALKWKARFRRLTAGTNALLSVGFLGLLVLMLNYAAYRYLDVRWNFSSLKYFELSEKTDSILAETAGEVKITSVFSQEEVLGDEVHYLLDEYEFSARNHETLTVAVEYVDPDRDLIRVKEIADRFGIEEPNFVLIELEDRSRVVTVEDLVDYESVSDYSALTGGQSVMVRKRRIGFRGEQAISSAIYSLSRETHPVVYFMQGHGERETQALKTRLGFGTIVREMQRDNISVATLTHASAIPEDCAAIVIAGPRTELTQQEINVLREYLDKNGRLLLLVDPGMDGGLNELLNEWGVTFDKDVVLSAKRTVTGKELMVLDYGAHPITKPLNGIFTVFYLPRSVNPISPTANGAVLAADRPKVTVLAGAGYEGWAERNFQQRPARFDEGQDRKGPIPIAVAVERGAVSRIDMELQPTRMVIIGDTDFASNMGLSNAGGGNKDLFMNSVNWLLERNSLVAISPKNLMDVRLQMDQDQIKNAYLVIIGLIPALVACLGLLIWVRRGR